LGNFVPCNAYYFGLHEKSNFFVASGIPEEIWAV
jgi:hypothetical protein